MPLQPAIRPGTRIALMDKFGTPWSGHGENLPVAFTGRNKNHGSFDHSPVSRLRWFPSSRDCESIIKINLKTYSPRRHEGHEVFNTLSLKNYFSFVIFVPSW